jgi:hypothetical protein
VRRQDLARYAALGVAGSRAAMGAAMVAAPRPFALAFAGRDGRHAGPQLLARAAGGRDAALGTAAAVALARGRDARLWTAAQLGADMTDLVATAAMGKDLPRTPRRIGLALAASASAVLAAALVGLREGKPTPEEMAGQPEQTMPASDTADGMGSVVMGGESQDDPGAGGAQPA